MTEPKLSIHGIEITNTDIVLEMVRDERDSQLAKWGRQDHSNVEWITILGEEFGEACHDVLHGHFGGKENQELLIGELIQVAAVAAAHVENILFGEA